MIGGKEITLTKQDGTEVKFILAKFDAISGREIVTQYPISGMPKLGEYSTNEELMLKMMTFVYVDTGVGEPFALTTRVLVTNHVTDWELLMKLEWASMEYNCSFFEAGKVSGFFEDLAAKIPESISSILTPLLDSYFLKKPLPSKNSEPSTA